MFIVFFFIFYESWPYPQKFGKAGYTILITKYRQNSLRISFYLLRSNIVVNEFSFSFFVKAGYICGAAKSMKKEYVLRIQSITDCFFDGYVISNKF